ncbi:MAG: aminopeptidase N, partial [Actinomycetota bacterium]
MQAGNLTLEEARERARLISDPRYRVTLDLTTSEETFRCETEVTFGCAEPGASTFLEYTAPAVASLELNGAPLSPEAFDGSRVHLSGLSANNHLRVVGESAYEHSGVGMHRFTDPADGRVYCYTDAEPYDIHRVYPCFDQPDLKGIFDFEVKAPAGWEVVSNGAPLSRPDAADGGREKWRFAATHPIPTYITAVVAGPYHAVRDRHRDIELGIYCRQSLARYLD